MPGTERGLWRTIADGLVESGEGQQQRVAACDPVLELRPPHQLDHTLLQGLHLPTHDGQRTSTHRTAQLCNNEPLAAQREASRLQVWAGDDVLPHAWSDALHTKVWQMQAAKRG